MRAWQRWQEAQSTLQKKREAEAKLLWANKPDKLQQAKEEITEVTVAVSTQLMQHSKSLVYTKMNFKGFSFLFKFLLQQIVDQASLTNRLQEPKQKSVSFKILCHLVLISETLPLPTCQLLQIYKHLVFFPLLLLNYQLLIKVEM